MVQLMSGNRDSLAGGRPITRTMLATARAISADAVNTYLAETKQQQVWLDADGREWKPLSTGGDLLWTETVVVPLTRSEVEERFGRLTAQPTPSR